jgi:uncharacterized protein
VKLLLRLYQFPNTYCISRQRESVMMCRVLTIHGAKDEIVPAEDARMFAANIPNHELRIMAGADHRYTGHEQELTSLVLDFIGAHHQSTSPLRPKL